MLKFRIKEIVDSNGNSTYVRQCRFLFIWINIIDDTNYITLEECDEWLTYQRKVKTIYHYNWIKKFLTSLKQRCIL